MHDTAIVPAHFI